MTNNIDIFDSIASFKDEFYNLAIDAVSEGLSEILKLSNNGKINYKQHEFPPLSYNDNGLPSEKSYFNKPPNNFSDIFNALGAFDRKPLVNEKDLSSFKRLIQFVTDRPDLRRRFVGDEFNDQANPFDKSIVDFTITLKIKNAIDRFIHINKCFEPDLNKIKNILEPIINYIFNKKLFIDIIIPILFIKFDFDSIIITDNVEISNMDDALQQARNMRNVKSYNVSIHDSVLSSATHALVLKNWSVENSVTDLQFRTLYSPHVYPLPQINKFFGSIRIVTGFNTGYAQLLALSKEWANNYTYDLPYIEGATIRSYPNRFEDYYWNSTSIPLVKEAEAKQIGEIYLKLIEAKENSIDIAVKRLNTCLVRDNEEDSVLDATIALEALLSDDGHQEMTHKLAMRIAFLSKFFDDNDKTPDKVFKDVKDIYSYRSAIVHGSTKLDKKRMIKVDNENKVEAQTLVVEYLRLLLRLLIENEKYRDPKTIDRELLLGS